MNRLLLKSSSSLLSGCSGVGGAASIPRVSASVASPAAAAAAAATAMILTAATLITRCQQQQQQQHQDGEDDDHDDNFRIEVHLMDKIQQKSYLQEAKDGIPSTLRILAIDLPEMRTDAFKFGDCRLSHESIFVDDIAPPKTIQVPSDPADNAVSGGEEERRGNDDKAESTKSHKRGRTDKLKIAQKALVKSLVYCRSNQSQQPVGVEMLEGSVADLNKYELRKTRQFGNYEYDPGKYYHRSTSSSTPRRESNTRRFNTRPHYEDYGDDDDEMDEVDQDEEEDDGNNNSNSKWSEIEAKYEDEIEAPWNQYAWAEEMRLRIQGHVKWNAPMEKSSRFQRLFFGSAYKVTIPPVSKFWEFLLPKFAKSDPDGIDGSNGNNSKSNKNKNRAANKPHAVIANGAALQRVPSALRLLQKLCRKADVPLFVIHDPRVWGGNTHQSLSEALKEMRSTIKNRVISKALQQRGSSAFTRGRMMGQMETETKWQIKEQTRKTKEIFTFGDSSATRRRKSDIDWGKLDSTTLEKKFITKGLIQKQSKQLTEEDDGGDLTATTKTYSVGLIQLAKQVCIDEEEKQSQSNSNSNTGDEEDGSAQEADSEEEKKPAVATMGATVHT